MSLGDVDDLLDRAFRFTDTKSGTHLPYLLQAVRASKGLPMLELGMGQNSTLQLHQASCILGWPLCSYENNAEWMEQFTHLGSSLHLIEHVDDWEDVPYEATWGVVLVDQSPGAARGLCLPRLHRAELIVCHDTEGDPCYGWERVIPQFKYVRTFQSLWPWTTIVSNSVDVTGWPDPVSDANHTE